MEEKTLFEILLDSDDNSNVALGDDDGNVVEFEQIALIVLDGHYYTILHPLNVPEIDETEAVVFELDDSQDEEVLQGIEDKQLLERIYAEYHCLLEESEN